MSGLKLAAGAIGVGAVLSFFTGVMGTEQEPPELGAPVVLPDRTSAAQLPADTGQYTVAPEPERLDDARDDLDDDLAGDDGDGDDGGGDDGGGDDSDDRRDEDGGSRGGTGDDRGSDDGDDQRDLPDGDPRGGADERDDDGDGELGGDD